MILGNTYIFHSWNHDDYFFTQLQSVIKSDTYAITRDFMELDIPKGGLNKSSGVVSSTCATPIALKYSHEYSGDVYKGEDSFSGDEGADLGNPASNPVESVVTRVDNPVRPTSNSFTSAFYESAKSVSSISSSSGFAALATNTESRNQLAADQQRTPATRPIKSSGAAVNTSRSSKPFRTPKARPPREPIVEEDMFGPIVKKSSP